jgi:hypothetical protein
MLIGYIIGYVHIFVIFLNKGSQETRKSKALSWLSNKTGQPPNVVVFYRYSCSRLKSLQRAFGIGYLHLHWSQKLIARGRPPVDVPQRYVPRCMQRICSSTHKASLVMVFSRILHWWRLGVSYGVRLGGAGGRRRSLATVVAWNSRDRFVFLDLIGFYLQI